MNAITRSLDQITTEAKFLYNRIEKDYAKLGELMIEAKKLVPHGEWLDYLAMNFPMIGKRQANRYMELAKDPTKTLENVTQKGEISNESLATHLIPAPKTPTRPRTIGDLQPTSPRPGPISRQSSPSVEIDELQKSFASHIYGMQRDLEKIIEIRKLYPAADVPIRQSFRNTVELAFNAMERFYEHLNAETSAFSRDNKGETLQSLEDNRDTRRHIDQDLFGNRDDL